jgi:hypothetical protein
MNPMVKYYYQIATDSQGEIYLEAEQQLIAQGESIVPFLQEQLKTSQPIPRLIAQVILQWINDNQKFQECFDYFQRIEQRTAATPMGTPPPESVAEYLFQNFDDSVASLLGVYLLKLEQVWPSWKLLSSILYLGRLNSDASADVLIRFVSTTHQDHYRKLAVDSLVAVGDRSVLSKIETALQPLEAAHSGLRQAQERITASITP